MPPQLFSYVGPRWKEVTRQAGSYFQQKWVGRGVATNDFDQDGDMDLVVVHQNEIAALLENQSERSDWIGLTFVGRTSNRFGVGVRVNLKVKNEAFTQQLVGGGSYASSHEKYMVFGWPKGLSETCDLEVHWPSGKTEGMSFAVNQRVVITEPF